MAEKKETVTAGRRFRLAHGWTLSCAPLIPESLVREFIRPAVRAVPSCMARRIGACRIAIVPELKPGVASQWSVGSEGLEIAVAAQDLEAHDAAMEVLICLGQALWERLEDAERAAYWKLLGAEIDSGVEGEIDDQTLERKRELFQRPAGRFSLERLLEYGLESFGATAAEYIHCLWHDVTVQPGPDCLPPLPLRRRLDLLAAWFPPDRGYRLYGRAPRPSPRAGNARS